MQKAKKNHFYLILTSIIILSPILVSFFVALDFKLNINILSTLYGIIFPVILLIRLFCSFLFNPEPTKKQSKQLFSSIFKNPILFLSLILIISFVLSSIINGFNLMTFSYLSFFFIVICFFKLNSNEKIFAINLLLLTTAVCCLRGFIDPHGFETPGFLSGQVALSLQFYNPNHSGYIMATMLMLSIGLFENSKSIIRHFFYSIISLIYIVFLFMNASFAPITFAFICIFLMLIYNWCKTNKFPIKTFLSFITMIIVCLLIEFIPNINSIRTSGYNYFIEVIDIINHYFHTNIPIPKLWGASTEYLSKNSTINAYTFTERQKLMNEATEVFANNSARSSQNKAVAFLFGFGAGTYLDYSPHNIFLSLALDYGWLVSISFGLLIVATIIKTFKMKKPTNTFYLPFALICFVLCGLTGSLVPYSAIYLFIVLGLNLNSLKEHA